MMRSFLCFFLIVGLLVSCNDDKKITEDITNKRIPFTGVKIDTLLIDSISIRAILVDQTKQKVWFAANKGRVGSVELNTNKKKDTTLNFEGLEPHFRGIAQTASYIFALSIESPGLLYKISKHDFSSTLVYKNTHEQVFFNSIKFWNESVGIAVGDPIDNCLTIIMTHDGGNTWKKIPCHSIPPTQEGEVGFSASNTNMVINSNQVWIFTGGAVSRAFYSQDKGETWSVNNIPFIKGGEMTGVFSGDFYSDTVGFIVGGDYDNPESKVSNKALTINGGKNWMVKSTGENMFGYASCVQYVPNSGGQQLVVVGKTGLYYSKDNGETWVKLVTDDDLYTITFVNPRIAIVAGKNKILKITFTS
jgi:hypothetical protein